MQVDLGDPSDLLVAALLLAPASYIGTNLDNLLILSALLAQAVNRAMVVVGFLVANLAVLFVAGAASVAAFVLPTSYLGLLGLVPIALGVRVLVRAGTLEPSAVSVGTWPAVAVVILVNSGDTLAVFGPLFAESEVFAAAGLALGFAFAAIVTLSLAQRATKHRWLSATIEAKAPRLVPWIMIGIGLYVLADSTTDLV